MPVLLVTVALAPLLITPGFLFYFDITPKVVVVLAGAALGLLWALAYGCFRALWLHRVGRLLAVLLFAQALSLVVSTVLSADAAISIHGSVWRVLGLVVHGAILVFTLVIAAALAQDKTRIMGFLRATAAAGMLIALYALAQYSGWDPWLPADRYHVGEGIWQIVRPPSTLGHSGYLAAHLLLVVFAGAALAAVDRQPFWRGLGVVASVLGCLGIVASGTRAALAGLAIGAFVTFLFLRLRLSRRAALASFIGVVALSAFYYSPSGQKLRARVRWYTEDPAGGPRLLMWRDSARMFARYWPAGSGPETFSLVFPRFQSAELSSAYPDFYHESPHNFLLDAATSQGIPGVALLLAMCSLAYFAALRSSVENRTLAGILAGGLSGVITAHLFTSFIVPTLLGFYLLIAMMVLLDAGGVRSQAAPRPRWIVAAAASPLAVLLIVYAWRLLSADRSLALAREHLEAGRILEARLSYERSIRLHPRGAVADLWYSRAMALAAQKSDQPARRLLAWQEGIEAARRATQSSDDRHNAWYNVAAFYASQNDFGRTEQSLRSAIGCSPNWFKPHWMLARVLREAGRLPEAIAEAQIAAKLNGGKNQEVRATLELLLASNSGAEKKK